MPYTSRHNNSPLPQKWGLAQTAEMGKEDFYERGLQQFGQLEKLHAVGAFDENVEAFGAVGLDGCLHLVHVGKGTLVVACSRKFGTYEPYVVEVVLLDEIDDFLVLFGTGCPQFAHIAQDGHFGRNLHVTVVGKGSHHAGRVGIVSIDDEVVVARFFELGTIVLWHIVAQSMIYLLGRDAKISADGSSSKGVVDVVRADKVGLNEFRVLSPEFRARLCTRFPTESEVRIAYGDLTADGEIGPLGRTAVAYKMEVVSDAVEIGVVVMDEHHTAWARAQEIVKLALGSYDAFERAEALEVRLAHIGDDAVVGFHNVDKGLYLTWVVGSHLHHCNIVLRTELQQCFGHANMVVEITLRIEYAELLGEHGGDEFLGGGFAIGSRHTNDAGAQAAAVIIGQKLQCAQNIIDQDDVPVGGISELRLVNHSVCTALLQGSSGVCVAIE